MEENVARLLRGWGFSVELIEEKFERKTPDLFVENNSESFLIEVKTRGKNAPFPTDVADEPYRTIKRRFKRSMDQLDECRKEADFKLTWFTVASLHCATKVVKQLLQVLYGLREEIVENKALDKLAPDEFYFRRGLFQPGADGAALLDAVIIQGDSRLFLCENRQAENFAKFTKTKFHKFCRRNFTLIPSGL